MQRAGSGSALAREVTHRGNTVVFWQRKSFNWAVAPTIMIVQSRPRGVFFFLFLHDGSTQDESVAPQGREPFSTRGESESGSTPRRQTLSRSLCWSSE